MELKLTAVSAVASNGALTKKNAVFALVDREHAQIKKLMVKCAKREAVLLDVGPACLVPLNMGGFKSRRPSADS